jgi:hypothetical protein
VERCAPESLQVVGDVVLHFLRKVDGSMYRPRSEENRAGAGRSSEPGRPGRPPAPSPHDRAHPPTS